VVDMQNGFITSATEHIIPGVLRVIGRAISDEIPVALTRFRNYPQSGYVKWINWCRFMGSPEVDICPSLSPYAGVVFDKGGYTAFTSEFEAFVHKESIGRIFFCGVATDGCVLKSAVDAFERNIEPVIIRDACASHAGSTIHDAGLLLASRFIGRYQLLEVDDILGHGFGPASDYRRPR